MKTKIIEVTQSLYHGFNWGKILVGSFDHDEWTRRSDMPYVSSQPLIGSQGWSPDHLLFLDLATGEGAIFRPGGYAKADLDKHRIWVCPMFEPFLDWAYTNLTPPVDLGQLPDLVELPAAPASTTGYRRSGPDGVDRNERDLKNAQRAAGAPHRYGTPQQQQEGDREGELSP